MSGKGVVGDLRVNLGVDAGGFGAGLAKASAGLSGFLGGAAKLGTAFAATFAAAGLAAGGAFATIGLQALTAADDIGDAAARIGISGEAFQKLGAAASAAGGTPELMTAALDKLNLSLGVFKQTGGGPAADAFNRLGIASKIASGEVKTADQAFYAIAKAMEGVADPAQKAALATEFFGKVNGPDMLEVLSAGEKALRSFGDQFGASGRLLSEEMITKLPAMKVKLDETKLALSQIATVFAGEALLAAVEWTESLGPTITAVQKLGGQVMDYLMPSFQALGDAFTSLMSGPAGPALIATFKAIGAVVGGALVVSIKAATVALTWLVTGMDDSARKAHNFMAGVVAAVNAIPRAVATMVDAIASHFARLGQILLKAIPGVDLVTKAFANMENKVTKNSYVPDMVDEIGAQFARLDGVMVAPALAATAQTGAAFKSLQSASEGVFDPLLSASSVVDGIGAQFRRLDSVMVKPTQAAVALTAEALATLKDKGEGLFGRLMTGNERAVDQFAKDSALLGQLMAANVISLEKYRETMKRVGAELSEATKPFEVLGKKPLPTLGGAQILTPDFTAGARGVNDRVQGQQDDENRQRETFARTFGDGMKAALSGQAGDWIKSWWQQKLGDAMSRAFEQAGRVLFDQLGKWDLGGSLGGGSKKSGGGLFSAVASIASAFFGGSKGFKTGGSFTVGGSGGPDSKYIGMRVTPGEMVNISRPGHDNGPGGGQVISIAINAQGAVLAQQIYADMAKAIAGAVPLNSSVTRGDANRHARNRLSA